MEIDRRTAGVIYVVGKLNNDMQAIPFDQTEAEERGARLYTLRHVQKSVRPTERPAHPQEAARGGVATVASSC